MTDEIRAELERCESMPEGLVKVQRLESLAEQSRAGGDRALEVEVLYSLGNAYEWSAEYEKLPLVMTRLLRLLEEHPAEAGGWSHQIHWMLKWMTSGMCENSAVPLPTLYRWLDELDDRYLQRGYSLRPVLALRGRLATYLGDIAKASEWMEASIAAPRDAMSDCEACERGKWGDWRIAAGDDSGALEYWAPVLNGALRCKEEPHRVLAKSLLPFVRTGQVDEARGAFLRGYPMARFNYGLTTYIGHYAEFCALTGNEARGLEILTENAAWLAKAMPDADSRRDYIVGASVLLRRLSALGHGGLPAGPRTVDDMLTTLDGNIRVLCAQEDARNGNTAASTWVADRLAQKPLLDALPLGLPARLPAGTGLPAGTVLPTDTAPAREAGEPAGVAASQGDLVAHARRLTAARHPDAEKAWARVAAGGADLSGDVAVAVTRSRAGELMRTDPDAARTLLLAAASAFAQLGDLDGELEARATAAVATQLAGQPEAAREAIREAAARAEDAFAGGTLTPRHYLNVRVSAQLMLLHALDTAAERDPADVDAVESGVAEVLAVAEDLGQRYHVGRCHELLWRLAAMRGDRGAAMEHLHASREAFLAADAPWFAAIPDVRLAEFALRDGNGHAAERLARDALRHGAGEFSPRQVAQLWSLVVDSISRQRGREADLADAALTAAARWDGLSERDTVHSTFIAARAYHRLGRNAAAAALFAQAMPKVDVPYEPAAVAVTRDQYGRSLRAIGRHREAAGQFLEAARLVADDPGSAQPHAMLAVLAAEELRASGQLDAARSAFLRAGELLAAVGDIAGRDHCLRSAQALQPAGDQDPQDSAGQDPAGQPDPADS